MKKIMFFAILLALGSSCKKDSSDIDQNTIYQQYVMKYDEESDQTTVTANFYEDKLNGKNLELTGGSTVTMNGTAMSKSGSTYSTSVSGNLATASLIFTDADGKKYTNTINKANYIGNDSQTYLDNNYTGYWYWYGNTIATGETVDMTMTSQVDNTKYCSFSETTVGRDYVKMLASSLSVLPSGNTKVFISRTFSTTTGNFATVGGKISAVYKGLYNYVEIY